MLLLVFPLLGSALFGAWSWQRPASGGNPAGWPASMPAFASGVPAGAYELKAGSSFVCTTVPGGRDAALARARAAFAEAGWSVLPIRTRDMLMFTRGDAVAAVLAEEIATGTRLAAIQRPKGL
ncbi:MAG: hypothetical protein IJ658_04040 [Kiritimatiellae bacterium]|nr:hypothetical protein [Kiritimatiellia bacterium]